VSDSKSAGPIGSSLEDWLVEEGIRDAVYGDVMSKLESQTAEPRGCPTPGVCSALAEIRILRSQVEALHAAVRTAYEDGFEEAACRGGSTVDDDLASAAVDGILNKAIDAAMRSVAAGTP